MIMKKVVFLTGTRADFGKMKPLMQACEEMPDIKPYVYVSGMHLLEKYGSTYREILKEEYSNVFLQRNRSDSPYMDINLATLIKDFSDYVRQIRPDLIMVHGDRIDALAGAIVAMLNGICLGHIEGGEVTGTVDEAIRHAISKMANIHFTANNESYFRLKQMGEDENDIFVIGSPDIDIMLSNQLPSLDDVKKRYHIHFKQYGILIYHPVTSELDRLASDISVVVEALKESGENYLIIYPNNDTGSEMILSCYDQVQGNPYFQFFPSISFEPFLTLLKNAKFIIGNSSCGVREACVYGIPAIDIGTRQKNRYSTEIMPNIRNVNADIEQILQAISEVGDYRIASSYFGDGNSAKKFAKILGGEYVWKRNMQKCFRDTLDTRKAIAIYHNEVCF